MIIHIKYIYINLKMMRGGYPSLSAEALVTAKPLWRSGVGEGGGVV